MWAPPTLGGDPLEPPKLYGCLGDFIICGHAYIGGETPQTPLSVFDVGSAHVRGRPPKTPKIVGGKPPNPP